MPSRDELTERLKQFKDFVDTIKGNKDVKTRVSVLADPENLDTMSILSKGQARTLANTNFLVGCRGIYNYIATWSNAARFFNIRPLMDFLC